MQKLISGFEVVVEREEGNLQYWVGDAVVRERKRDSEMRRRRGR